MKIPIYHLLNTTQKISKKIIIGCMSALLFSLVAIVAQADTASIPQSTITSQVNGLCVGIGAQKLAMQTCSTANEQIFEFTSGGAIVVAGRCLEIHTNKSLDSFSIRAGDCTGSDNQLWERTLDSIKSPSTGLCLALLNKGVGVSECSGGKEQSWALTLDSTEYANWPTPKAGVVSSQVAGSTLTVAQLQSTLDWIKKQISILTTPFCWKKPTYDRGAGVTPSCNSDSDSDGGLCYPKCRSDYKGVGPVCWTTQSLTYTPGRHNACTKTFLGNICVSKPDSCRDGYHGDGIATCYIDKASYGRGAGSLPTACNSNREFEAGMCYLKPEPGFGCTLTGCQQVCAAGTTDCAAACTLNQTICISQTIDLISKTTSAADNMYSVFDDYPMFVADYSLSSLTNTNGWAATISSILSNSETFFELSRVKDIVDAKLIAKYGKDSPNYKLITREWTAQLVRLVASRQGTSKLENYMETQVDITGVLTAADAYKKPICDVSLPLP